MMVAAVVVIVESNSCRLDPVIIHINGRPIQLPDVGGWQPQQSAKLRREYLQHDAVCRVVRKY